MHGIKKLRLDPYKWNSQPGTVTSSCGTGIKSHSRRQYPKSVGKSSQFSFSIFQCILGKIVINTHSPKGLAGPIFFYPSPSLPDWIADTLHIGNRKYYNFHNICRRFNGKYFIGIMLKLFSKYFIRKYFYSNKVLS